ncbi:MAG TPA: hypothetical protein VF397_01415 [Pyrinomonadaceae bacterium]
MINAQKGRGSTLHIERLFKKKSEWLIWRLLLPVLVVGLGAFANFIADFIAAPEKPAAPNATARMSLFLMAILLLSMSIVGIAAFLRRRNRDVIQLKRRLSEIYLSALRKSAFNPETTSDSSHG